MKTLIIAESTARQTLRQPVLFLIAGLAALMIAVSRFFTLFTFGAQEQLSMMREMGLATITMAGLLYTIFAATLAISEDIERRSALTLLCKPVYRYEFILGKFLGISFTIFCVFTVLTICLLFSLWLAETPLHIGDILKGESDRSFWDIPRDFDAYCDQHAPRILKGVVLAYFEILLLNAISLAGATRLPMLVNLALCLLIFVIGNLSEYLYGLVAQSANIDLERLAALSWWQLLVDYPMVAAAKVFYVIIPNLDAFNISGELAYGQIEIPPRYILLTVSYGLVYTTIALLTALVSFEHRELM
jgi:hypothetical protein